MSICFCLQFNMEDKTKVQRRQKIRKKPRASEFFSEIQDLRN